MRQLAIFNTAAYPDFIKIIHSLTHVRARDKLKKSRGERIVLTLNWNPTHFTYAVHTRDNNNQ